MSGCRSAAEQAGVPEEIEFQTKPEIALEQIRQAMEQKVPRGVVLADAGYGKGTQFRTASPNSDCHMSWASSLPLPFGNRGNNHCRRRRENQAGARHPNACSATRIISPFRQSSWLCALACFGLEGRSTGAKAVRESCAPVSPRYASARPIAITNEPNHTRKNG